MVARKRQEKAADILERKFPGFIIDGRSNRYVQQSEIPLLLDRNNKSQARILSPAMGSPKHES